MIKAYMKDKVILKKIDTEDEWGSIVWKEVEIDARVEKVRKWIKNEQGEDDMSNYEIITEYDDILVDDKIILDGKEWKIKSVESMRDFSNEYYKVII